MNTALQSSLATAKNGSATESCMRYFERFVGLANKSIQTQRALVATRCKVQRESRQEKMKRFTKRQRYRVCALHDNGMTISEIAQIMKVKYDRIRYYLNRSKILAARKEKNEGHS